MRWYIWKTKGLTEWGQSGGLRLPWTVNRLATGDSASLLCYRGLGTGAHYVSNYHQRQSLCLCNLEARHSHGKSQTPPKGVQRKRISSSLPLSSRSTQPTAHQGLIVRQQSVSVPQQHEAIGKSHSLQYDMKKKPLFLSQHKNFWGRAQKAQESDLVSLIFWACSACFFFVCFFPTVVVLTHLGGRGHHFNSSRNHRFFDYKHLLLPFWRCDTAAWTFSFNVATKRTRDLLHRAEQQQPATPVTLYTSLFYR